MATYLKRWRRLYYEAMAHAMCSSDSDKEDVATTASHNSHEETSYETEVPHFDVPECCSGSSSSERDDDCCADNVDMEQDFCFEDQPLDKQLRSWAVRNHITRTALGDRITGYSQKCWTFRTKGSPFSTQNTTICIASVHKCDGDYVYLGLECSIQKALADAVVCDSDAVVEDADFIED